MNRIEQLRAIFKDSLDALVAVGYTPEELLEAIESLLPTDSNQG